MNDLKNYETLASLLLIALLIPFFNIANTQVTADTLPSAATVLPTNDLPDQYVAKEFHQDGPQTYESPDPQAPITAIWISEAPQVKSPVLYFDIDGKIYSTNILGSQKMFVTFDSPTSVTSVRVQIQGRTNPSDGLGIGYVYANQIHVMSPAKISNLPSDVIVTLGGNHSDELHSWVFKSTGPQIHRYPNPLGPVEKIYASVTTYVSEGVLYYDVNGETFSTPISPNSNMIIQFPIPVEVSNVKIGIMSRGYSDDAGNVSFFESPTPSKIPTWIRNIFIFYGQKQVSDDELLNAIKFLIQQKIIAP